MVESTVERNWVLKKVFWQEGCSKGTFLGAGSQQELSGRHVWDRWTKRKEVH